MRRYLRVFIPLAVSFLVFLNFSSNRFLYAQPSIIETVQNLFPSIVSISAQNRGMSAGSGRIVAGSYERRGSGVVIAPSGYIITNYHIVNGARNIRVMLFDNRIFEAQVIGIFADTDLALLRIRVPGELASAELADSENFSLGDEVFSVGHSEILDQTISEGRIIGLGLLRSGEKGTQLFQVNMNLYKGDSGGPLFDRQGRLAGIIVAGQTGADRSSFVVPSNSIKKLFLEALSKKEP